MRREFRTALWILGAMLLILVVGTAGYMLIDGWSFWRALYMTVATIFTVGYGDEGLSHAGKAFTVVLIVVGVGTILYGLGAMMEFVVGGQLSGVFRRRAVRRQVDKLEGHYIICGYGRVGEAVAQQFAAHRVDFVVVDNDPVGLSKAESSGFMTVRGDAATDEVLEEAGIKKAKGLVSAVGSDADNIFVVLSARVLNPSLLIVARAGSEDTVNKLERAGANQVVSPYGIGGKRMATLMLKPLVSDYLEVVTGGGELAFLVEEFQLSGDCCAIGQSIAALAVRQQTGATILAVRRASTPVLDTNPSAESVMNPGDKIIAIGTQAEIDKLERLIGAPARSRNMEDKS
jgi:voltage-gated potassium channel